MRKGTTVVFLLLFAVSAGTAQVPWGIGVEEEGHELAVKDSSSGIYYSAYPLQLNQGFIFGCRIISSVFNPQIRLYDAENKVVHEAGGEKINAKEYRMLTHCTVPANGMYTLVVAAPNAGLKGKYTLTNYLFQPIQFTYKPSFNFCERLAFFFNHAAADFLFLDTLEKRKVNALIVDSSAAMLLGPQPVYTNVVYNYTDENRALMHYQNCLANLRACLGAEYWAEKKTEGVTEGEELLKMAGEFTLKPAYGKGAVFRVSYSVTAATGMHRVEITVWK